MFAFRIKPGSEEFLKPILDVPNFEIVEGVVYYVLCDIDMQSIVITAEELDRLQDDEDDEIIRFE